MNITETFKVKKAIRINTWKDRSKLTLYLITEMKKIKHSI